MSTDLPPYEPSTGVAALDRALDGLYWGDNVVWQPDRPANSAPFFASVASLASQYDRATYVALTSTPDELRARYPGVDVLDARPDTRLSAPQPLLDAIREQSAQRGRALLLFDPLEDMADRWGVAAASRFFTSCCPFLLEVGAIAYWSLARRDQMESLRRDVEDVTQCVLVLRDGRLRIAKAEGRPVGVQGSVYHYKFTDGKPELTNAPAAARLGAALTALRLQRQLSQSQLAALAEVSPSAISQAERGQRGLSLETLLTLTAKLNITIDELLRGQVSAGYRLGRRDDPSAPPVGIPVPLLDDPEAGLRIYLVRLAPGAFTAPNISHKGAEIVAVIAGLVQVQLTSGRPVLRQGEAVLADRSSIRGWQNLSQRPAALFWVVRD
jgi:transcriptional regulator with XRE-family HTH domain